MDQYSPLNPSERVSRGRGLHERGVARFFAVSLALFACQETERPRVTPAATPEGDQGAPSISAPLPEEPAPHDDFHALLAKPAFDQAADEVPAEVLTAAVARSNAASFELWRAFEKRENFVVSPYSIRSALGLVYLASSPGRGRSRLRSRFRYPARNEDSDIRLLDGVVRAVAEPHFDSTNAIWVARQHMLDPAYLEAVSQSLPAEVHSIDFAADPGRAEQTIDAWVSDRTRGKIPSILEGGSVHELTRSVLVDAAYLSWEAPLNPQIVLNKFTRSFSTSRGQTVQPDMAMIYSCMALLRNDYKVAFAEYRSTTSPLLVVIMPNRWRAFRWNAAAFRRVWADKDRRIAECELPKLRLRSRQDIGAVLAKLEIDPVDPRLQQGRLASVEPVPIPIGAMVHESSIQIDETPLVSVPLMDMPNLFAGEIHRFHVDRPFYFMLVERRTGLILLMGQATDPTLAAD